MGKRTANESKSKKNNERNKNYVILKFASKILIIILLLLIEIFSYSFYVRNGKIIPGSLNLVLNNSLWTDKGVFVYSFSWLYFVIASVVLFLLLKDKIKILNEEKNRLEFRYLLYHLLFLTLFVILNVSIWKGNSLSYHLLIFVWYLLILCFSLSLFFFVFGSKTVFGFLGKYKTDVLGSLLISYLFIGTYFLLSKIWIYLSAFVGKSIYYLLNIFYENVRYSPASYIEGVLESAPVIGVGKFNALIVKECAGIEGIALFLFLFTIVVLIDHKQLNFVRVLFLYLLGIIGMIILNIFRIFILILIGVEYSGGFAVGVAHSNLGWILFGLFFFVFLYIFYGWMRKI